MAAYEYLLTDIATDATLLDLTGYATAQLQPLLDRPLAVALDLSSHTPGLLDIAYDGDPNLSKGTRALKVKRDGVLIAHNKLWTAGWDADENTSNCKLLAFSGMQQLFSRTCFDATGHLADFQFPSPTTGAQMLQGVIGNSVTYEDLDIGAPAILPIDYTGGTWSSTVDLYAEFVNTPITIGDLIVALTRTAVFDVGETPVDTSLGAAPGILSRLNGVDRWGSDKTGIVSFDYGTGAYNVKSGRRTDSIDTLCNRLTYELGPKNHLIRDHWQGNITGTETTPVDLSAWQINQLASRAKYGTFANVRLLDGSAENTVRALFHALWKAESTFRVFGRDLFMLTPAANAPQPFADYMPGDTVTANVAAPLLGPAIEGVTQRIYGFTVDVDKDSVESVSELIVSAAGE